AVWSTAHPNRPTSAPTVTTPAMAILSAGCSRLLSRGPKGRLNRAGASTAIVVVTLAPAARQTRSTVLLPRRAGQVVVVGAVRVVPALRLGPADEHDA